jgi:heme-degrading monooxygenase HmoA
MSDDRAAYAERLELLSDEQLADEAERYIWLSAWANNNGRSAYHWMCDMTYGEASRRGKTEIYAEAHKRVMRQEGFR